MKRTTISERGLVLAPLGRDASVAVDMLGQAGVAAEACASLTHLVDQLERGAAFVLLTEEALATADLTPLSRWLADQEEWSDLPFILLTRRGGGLERNPSAKRYLAVLGNVTFLERPFHPTTLVSLAQSALRGRRRQYEARARLNALRDSEGRFRAAVGAVQGLLWTNDALGRMSGDQPGWSALTGQTPEQYEGYGWASAVHPDDAQATVDEWNRSVAEERPFIFEHRVRRHDGEWRTYAVHAVPVAADDGTIHEWVGVHRDITEARTAEAALRAETQTLETLNLTGAAIAADLDLERVVQRVTDAGVSLVGARFGAFFYNVLNDKGESYMLYTLSGAERSAFDGFGMPRATAVFKPTFVGEGVIRSDDIMADPRYGKSAPHHGMPKGHLPVRSYLAVPVTSRTGSVIGGLFFGHPEPGRFTVRHEQLMRGLAGQAAVAIDNATLYQELQKANETLEQRVETATTERQTALAQLHEAQKLETLGQLTGGVAHDFNNLLTPITGALDLLSRKVAEDDKRTARLIDNALQSAERAKTLVARLLGFARRVSLESRPVDLGQLVDGMRDLIASSVGQSIELRISAAPDLPAALVDPNQLELAILNLCVNGRDAMPKGGTLILAVEQALLGPRSVPGLAPGAYVRLSVIDTGTGMDADTLKRAIEPFFSTKELGRGTGLGLSMVHGLAAQLGGGFMLSSEPGEGTRADLYLPAADRAASTRPQRQIDPAESQGDPMSILLVDDEDIVRTATAEMLRDMGHHVVEAAGGAEALTRLGTGRFDVVLTDYMMPQMDGGELAERIRQRQPAMPILIITGYSGGDLNLAVPHMAKPFRQHELAARLRTLTASSDRKVVPISGPKG